LVQAAVRSSTPVGFAAKETAAIVMSQPASDATASAAPAATQMPARRIASG
jgi:hypothetical protein